MLFAIFFLCVWYPSTGSTRIWKSASQRKKPTTLKDTFIVLLHLASYTSLQRIPKVYYVTVSVPISFLFSPHAEAHYKVQSAKPATVHLIEIKCKDSYARA